MTGTEVYHEYGEELERRLRLKSYPIALKLLQQDTEIPHGAFRPLCDLGKHLSLCQAFQMSRRDGTTVAMLREDNWCFEPVVGYGLEEPPVAFLEGRNRFPRDVATLEAGRHYAEDFPRFETGKYIGVASAPLRSTSFEPDLVVIYCDSSQLNLLLLARECRDGRGLRCALSSHAACVYSVVPPMQSGDCQVAVPCRGDHYNAMAGDEEMILTVPKDRLQDLMWGLRYVAETGSKMPRGYTMAPEYRLPDAYRTIGDMMAYLKSS